MEYFEDEEKLPWPRIGDTLFKADEDWSHNACLNFSEIEWGVYASGYKQAGDVLVEHIKQIHSRQDFLVYPIVFLYRQYLELRLKQLIDYGHDLLDDAVGFPKHHHLDKLWSECKAILRKVDPRPSEIDLDAMDKVIKDFCASDPSSEGFRYPFNKEGSKSLPDKLEYINLRNLAEVMNRLAGFMEACIMMLSHYRDLKSNMWEDIV